MSMGAMNTYQFLVEPAVFAYDRFLITNDEPVKTLTTKAVSEKSARNNIRNRLHARIDYGDYCREPYSNRSYRLTLI